MKTSRRSFFGALFAAPLLARVNLTATPPPMIEPPELLIVRANGRLIDASNILVETMNIRTGESDHNASFRTDLLDIKPGEELRIYYRGSCLFNGHVQRITINRPCDTCAFADVDASDWMLTCKRPPAGWWCSRKAGHKGPCAAHSINPLHDMQVVIDTMKRNKYGAL